MSARTVVLSYAGQRWRAAGEGLDLVHTELRGLEGLIEERVAVRAEPVRVHLAFDMTALPRWLHQYHAHYLNYTLVVPPRAAS